MPTSARILNAPLPDWVATFEYGAIAGNGEIVAVGEAYDTQAAAKEGCAAVQRAADGATVVEAGS